MKNFQNPNKDSALTKNAFCGKPSAWGLFFLSGAWKLNHISVDIETTSFCNFREPNTSLTNYFEQLSEGKFEGGFNSFESNTFRSKRPWKWPQSAASKMDYVKYWRNVLYDDQSYAQKRTKIFLGKTCNLSRWHRPGIFKKFLLTH